MTQETFLDILYPQAPARELTAKKADMIMRRDGYKITGFVMRKDRQVCIVDCSAVRWLSDKEMFWLMHNSKSPLCSIDV